MTANNPTPSREQDCTDTEVPAFGIDQCRRLKAFEESNREAFNRLVEAIGDDVTRPILRTLVARDGVTVPELAEHTGRGEGETTEEVQSLEWAELVETTGEKPPVVRLAGGVADETIIAMLSLRNRLEATERHT